MAFSLRLYVVVLVAFLVFRWLRKGDDSRLPPGLKAWPLVGNLPVLLAGGRINENLLKLSSKYIFAVSGSPLFITSGPVFHDPVRAVRTHPFAMNIFRLSSAQRSIYTIYEWCTAVEW
ncbi:hypothetical protein M758_9G056800 [Ceratodon purpureus]|nr:hypothetical protein M758_9G056800 [Ceratodon purpureus]